ncbi:MAG: hypothetical protein H6867_02725 [Rhodospirillales bacterium]|nr:hypothetical protein [Rhodospirillales bacterium]MCB9997103.1 hypothetical protein [Rhodospirillales bacterium]
MDIKLSDILRDALEQKYRYWAGADKIAAKFSDTLAPVVGLSRQIAQASEESESEVLQGYFDFDEPNQQWHLFVVVHSAKDEVPEPPIAATGEANPAQGRPYLRIAYFGRDNGDFIIEEIDAVGDGFTPSETLYEAKAGKIDDKAAFEAIVLWLSRHTDYAFYQAVRDRPQVLDPVKPLTDPLAPK